MWMNSFTRSSLLCPGATLKEVCKRRHNWNNNFILRSDQQTWFRLAFKMYMLGFYEAPKDTQSEINFWWFFVFGKRRENFMACLQRCHFFHSWCCWEIVAGKLEQRLRWVGSEVATRDFVFTRIYDSLTRSCRNFTSNPTSNHIFVQKFKATLNQTESNCRESVQISALINSIIAFKAERFKEKPRQSNQQRSSL